MELKIISLLLIILISLLCIIENKIKYLKKNKIESFQNEWGYSADNADNFETNFPYWNIDAWYGYNNSAYYEASSTPRACYFNIQPSQYTASYATAMIIIHVGTSSGTIPIRISGSANDFSNTL